MGKLIILYFTENISYFGCTNNILPHVLLLLWIIIVVYDLLYFVYVYDHCKNVWPLTCIRNDTITFWKPNFNYNNKGRYKRYFIIDQQIARHFVHYCECLSLLCNSNNKPFFTSSISANHNNGWLRFGLANAINNYLSLKIVLCVGNFLTLSAQ